MAKPLIQLFDPDTVEQIIQEAYELLLDPGVNIQNLNCLKMLAENGVTVNYENFQAKFPEIISRAALQLAPAGFSLYNFEGEGTIHYGSDQVYFSPGSSALTVLDQDSQQIRPGLTDDLVSLIKTVESLEDLDAQSTAIVCSDVPQEIADLYRLYLALIYSSKPIITGSFHINTLKLMEELLEVSCRSKSRMRDQPRAIFDICPISPLTWGETAAQNLLDCSRSGIPMQIVPMPMAGGTSPVTLAGTVVQHTAECLSGVIISQLASPGTRVVWGAAPAILDLRTGSTALGAGNSWLLGIAYAQIGRALNLPTQSFMGISDAKMLDAQAGLESSSSILAACAGVNMITGAGMLAQINCQSLDKLAFDAEVIRLAKIISQGFPPFQSPLGLDLIREVGSGGDYLSHPHTRDWYRVANHFPSPIIDRRSPQDWLKNGGLSSQQQSRLRVKELIKNYPGSRLDDAAQKELHQITARAARAAGMDSLPKLSP